MHFAAGNGEPHWLVKAGEGLERTRHSYTSNHWRETSVAL